MRLVRRDRGSFTTEVGPGGEHGDTFDSHKLAQNSLESTGGALESTKGIRLPERETARPRFQPRRLA
jgi:hypothetical protein